MPDDIQRVAIAVVEQEGCYLVGRRRPGEVLAGRAEFPGGKCLPAEEASACAVRECHEETGLTVFPVRCLYACRHAYEHGTLDLEFWLCRPAPAETSAEAVPQNSGPGGGFEWVPVQALKSLDFPEANRPVIERLSAGIETVG